MHTAPALTSQMPQSYGVCPHGIQYEHQREAGESTPLEFPPAVYCHVPHCSSRTSKACQVMLKRLSSLPPARHMPYAISVRLCCTCSSSQFD